MTARVGSDYSVGIQQPILDVAGMIVHLSKEKQDSLVDHLKSVLSDRLGDALDTNVKYSSGTYVLDDPKDPEKITGVVLTSLKKAFLRTPLDFGDDIPNDFQNRYSKIARGESFTYTLEKLRRTHKWKTDICTSTPHLDPLVQTALLAAVEADKEYVLGFELDMAETKKQQQIVFSIFEKEGTKEISRIQVPESAL
jgi:hypothetical protein